MAGSFRKGGQGPQLCLPNEQPEEVHHLLRMSYCHWVSSTGKIIGNTLFPGALFPQAVGPAWVLHRGGAQTRK